MSTLEQQTIAVVDAQLVAYNNQDIDAFAATYHDDVEIYDFSAGLRYKGKDELINVYGPKFAQLTFLQATSLKRIVHGPFLIDHELAESSSLASKAVETSVKVVAAYEVRDQLIVKVSFMAD